ncbi:hypothetical protein DIPPA_17543 [Diplonema papillatum]|nr:hypothetical protein DIPPA_17543 [Diplonema papillatum]
MRIPARNIEERLRHLAESVIAKQKDGEFVQPAMQDFRDCFREARRQFFQSPRYTREAASLAATAITSAVQCRLRPEREMRLLYKHTTEWQLSDRAVPVDVTHLVMVAWGMAQMSVRDLTWTSEVVNRVAQAMAAERSQPTVSVWTQTTAASVAGQVASYARRKRTEAEKELGIALWGGFEGFVHSCDVFYPPTLPLSVNPADTARVYPFRPRRSADPSESASLSVLDLPDALTTPQKQPSAARKRRPRGRAERHWADHLEGLSALNNARPDSDARTGRGEEDAMNGAWANKQEHVPVQATASAEAVIEEDTQSEISDAGRRLLREVARRLFATAAEGYAISDLASLCTSAGQLRSGRQLVAHAQAVCLGVEMRSYVKPSEAVALYWASAAVSLKPEPVFLDTLLVPLVADLTGADIARVLWSSARLSIADASLSKRCHKAIISNPNLQRKLDASALMTIAIAIVVLKMSRSLYTCLSAQAYALLHHLTPREVAQLLHCFAQTRYKPEPFYGVSFVDAVKYHTYDPLVRKGLKEYLVFKPSPAIAAVQSRQVASTDDILGEMRVLLS